MMSHLGQQSVRSIELLSNSPRLLKFFPYQKMTQAAQRSAKIRVRLCIRPAVMATTSGTLRIKHRLQSKVAACIQYGDTGYVGIAALWFHLNALLYYAKGMKATTRKHSFRGPLVPTPRLLYLSEGKRTTT
jgi:hypothetical protein